MLFFYLYREGVQFSSRGNFNCNILVKNSAGTEDILNLWFIDSNNCCDDREVSHYDWVHEDQIQWYENKVQEIRDAHDGKTIPAILFQHIPVYEENYVMREAKLYERPFAAKGSHAPFDKYYIKHKINSNSDTEKIKRFLTLACCT